MPGYRDELDMRFRVETATSFQSKIAKGRGKTTNTSRSIIPASHEHRPYTPVKIFASTDVEHLALHGTGIPYEADETFAILSTYYCSPLQYPLADSRSEHSIPFLIHQFSSDVAIGNAANSFINFSHIISNAKQGSPLYYACKTLGSSYLLSATRSHDIMGQAQSYANTVAAINLALQDFEECKADGTLLSIWLLRLYTVLWSTQDGIDSLIVTCESDFHFEGMMQLVRLRGVSQFMRSEGRDIFWNIIFTVLHRALVTSGNPSSEILKWINELYCHCGPPSYGAVRVAMFAYHCVRICSSIQGLIKLGDLDKLLSSSESIIDDIYATIQLSSHGHLDTKKVLELASGLHRNTSKLAEDNIALDLYQSEFKMRLLSYGIQFLRHVSEIPVCTSQQQEDFSQSQDHYVKEFQDMASQILFFTISMWDMESIVLSDELKRTKGGTHSAGLPDALRTLNPLALIAQSSISLCWQKTTAKNILGLMYKRLRVM